MQGEPAEQLVAVAIGSNVGDGVASVCAAFARLSASPLLRACVLSPLYRTVPVRVSPDGPDPGGEYINAVMVAYSRAEPDEVLSLLNAVELAGGRSRRVSPHGAPRPIDLDLLVVGERRVRNDRLVLPHPGIAGRAFVLVPLADLVPDLVVPVLGVTAAELLGMLQPDQVAGVRRIDA